MTHLLAFWAGGVVLAVIAISLALWFVPSARKELDNPAAQVLMLAFWPVSWIVAVLQIQRRAPLPEPVNHHFHWHGCEPLTRAELEKLCELDHAGYLPRTPVTPAILGDLLACDFRRVHDGGPCEDCLPDPERDDEGYVVRGAPRRDS